MSFQIEKIYKFNFLIKFLESFNYNTFIKSALITENLSLWSFLFLHSWIFLNIENRIMPFPLKTQTSLIFYGSSGFRRKCILHAPLFCNNNLKKRTLTVSLEIYPMSRWRSTFRKTNTENLVGSPRTLMAIESEPYWTLQS